MSKPRGFATMTPERRREVASKGGKNSQAGKGFRFASFTREQHVAFGSRGGKATQARRAAERAKQDG